MVRTFNKSDSLYDVELAFRLFEEHHVNVLNLVDVIFPSIFGFLNEIKLRLS